MNPRRLRLRNLRTFVGLDLALPHGKIAILGGNGAGKSTLATAIDWALFGPDARSWAPYLTQGAEDTEMLLELEFEHDHEVYKVRRGYSARGSGKSTLDLFRNALRDDTDEAGGRPDSWTPLSRETAKATQELIETTLGLTRETFRASSMLVQGDGAAFTEAQPRDRKAILARILGLERWDVYLAACRTDLRTLEARLAQIQGELAGADEEVAQRPDVEAAIAAATTTMAEAQLAGEQAKARFESADETLKTAGQNDANRAVAAARMAHAQEWAERLQERIAAATKAAGEATAAREELATVMTKTQIEQALDDLARLQRLQAMHGERVAHAEAANRAREQALQETNRLAIEIGEAERRARELLQRAAGYRDVAYPGEKCDHCGQPLESPEAREHAANQLEGDAAQAAAHARGLAERRAALEIPEPVEAPEAAESSSAIELSIARTMADDARAAQARTATLTERIRALTEQAGDRPSEDETKQAVVVLHEARVALDAVPAAADPAALERLRESRRSAEVAVDDERVRWQAASAEHARQQARLERIETVTAKVEAATAERGRLHETQDELDVLERAYGRDGIPAWIVGRVALPSIQAEATRILGELGTSYQCELRTLRATTGGDLVDALDVIIITEDGERPYETFSGGERTRINLALRIALARLLANRRRGESSLLVIDEPEFLDSAGTAALVEVIRGLTDFRKIWLISHVPSLRDTPLDGTLEVARGEDGWSTVTTS